MSTEADPLWGRTSRLYISAAAFDEIRDKLINAGYYWAVDEARPNAIAVPMGIFLAREPEPRER